MRKTGFFKGAFLALMLFVSACNGGGGSSTPNLVRVHAESGMHTFEVEVADSASERERGLMNRTDLDDDDGMLFVFPEDVYTSFWMKDTPLSLDIIFLDSDREIVFIAPSTVPNSTDMITPDRAIRYVLEVKAGFAARSGIQVGNQVSFD